jgi:hypothetical protein
MQNAKLEEVRSTRRRDKFGNVAKPSLAWANFKFARLCGDVPKTFTWDHLKARAQKRKRIRQAATLSRRKNRSR